MKLLTICALATLASANTYTNKDVLPQIVKSKSIRMSKLGKAVTELALKNPNILILHEAKVAKGQEFSSKLDYAIREYIEQYPENNRALPLHYEIKEISNLHYGFGGMFSKKKVEIFHNELSQKLMDTIKGANKNAIIIATGYVNVALDRAICQDQRYTSQSKDKIFVFWGYNDINEKKTKVWNCYGRKIIVVNATSKKKLKNEVAMNSTLDKIQHAVHGSFFYRGNTFEYDKPWFVDSYYSFENKNNAASIEISCSMPTVEEKAGQKVFSTLKKYIREAKKLILNPLNSKKRVDCPAYLLTPTQLKNMGLTLPGFLLYLHKYIVEHKELISPTSFNEKLKSELAEDRKKQVIENEYIDKINNKLFDTRMYNGKLAFKHDKYKLFNKGLFKGVFKLRFSYRSLSYSNNKAASNKFSRPTDFKIEHFVPIKLFQIIMQRFLRFDELNSSSQCEIFPGQTVSQTYDFLLKYSVPSKDSSTTIEQMLSDQMNKSKLNTSGSLGSDAEAIEAINRAFLTIVHSSPEGNMEDDSILLTKSEFLRGAIARLSGYNKAVLEYAQFIIKDNLKTRPIVYKHTMNNFRSIFFNVGLHYESFATVCKDSLTDLAKIVEIAMAFDFPGIFQSYILFNPNKYKPAERDLLFIRQGLQHVGITERNLVTDEDIDFVVEEVPKEVVKDELNVVIKREGNGHEQEEEEEEEEENESAQEKPRQNDYDQEDEAEVEDEEENLINSKRETHPIKNKLTHGESYHHEHENIQEGSPLLGKNLKENIKSM